MLRPLVLYKTDADGNVELDGAGQPIALPFSQQRPKREDELSAGDRHYRQLAERYETDRLERIGEAELLREARLAAADAVIARRESQK